MKKHSEYLTAPIFRVINNSSGNVRFPSAAQSAVNAMTLADQTSWDEAFGALMDQVHRLNLMPDNVRCIQAMFEADGFIRQPGVRDWVSVADVVRYMNENCHDGQIAIVRGVYSAGYVTVAPAGSLAGSEGFADPKRYHACGMRSMLNTRINDVWVRWADGEDHSPVKRRKGRGGKREKAEKAPPADHETFHYLQKNPRERTGDCVIRAFAALLDVSWDEAMDRLTAASDGSNTTVNSIDVYRELLRQEGFERRSPVVINGRRITGKAFCREMDRRQLGGARIFAHVGRSHVAAVIPFTEDGETHYKIVDSWDSTDRCIGEYWILYPPGQEPLWRNPPAEEPASREEPRQEPDSRAVPIPVGVCLIHPRFGRGTVRAAHPAGWVTVDFSDGASRQLDSKWVMKHCRMDGSAGAAGGA